MPSLNLIRESIEARIARRAANDLAAGRACRAARQHRDTDRTTTTVAVRSPTEPERRSSSKTARDGGATAGPTKLGNAEAASAPAAAASEPATARKSPGEPTQLRAVYRRSERDEEWTNRGPSDKQILLPRGLCSGDPVLVQRRSVSASGSRCSLTVALRPNSPPIRYTMMLSSTAEAARDDSSLRDSGVDSLAVNVRRER